MWPRSQPVGGTTQSNTGLPNKGLPDQGRESPPGLQPRSGRSVYLDALRAIALCRVVVYHASDAEWLQIIAAMPLMFFVAGSLYAASLERRSSTAVIRSRFRRILVPYWFYIAAMIALWGAMGLWGQITAVDWVGILFPVVSLGGPQGPGVGTPVEATWIALWYLQFHLLLSLVGPLLRRAQQRSRRVTWIVLGVLLAMSIVAGAGAAVVFAYVMCWMLGYEQHDGTLARLLRGRWVAVCAVAGPVGAVLFILYNDPSTWYGAGLLFAGAAAIGLAIFWIALAVGLRPRLEPMLQGRVCAAVIYWFAQRSLTIYMWHMVALFIVLELALPGAGSVWARLGWCALGTVIAVVATGWTEDLAARRPMRLWPVPARVTLS